ncbi:MAG: radical SAM protein, partial [Alphaproteobacteria bacterium]|nr:radical SAM protein [Alphaproteobacteria bacterium]
RKLLQDEPGIMRLRLSSMDPASPEIIKIMDIMAADRRMMRHMHLSMQSGADDVLRRMGRRHNGELIRKIAGRGEEIGVTFSWDIICGFPGETDELWAETMQLAEQTRPIKIHAFPFSPRPGTPAAEMTDLVPRAISKKRVKEISETAEQNRARFAKERLGEKVQVLVEENNFARDEHDITVRIEGTRIPPRTVCNVFLKDITGDAFIGERE